MSRRKNAYRIKLFQDEARIATVGDNCLDVYEKQGMVFTGGNPVNVAVYIVRLGGKASYTGVVGDDEYGRIVIEALRGKGVDTNHVRVEYGSTAVTKVELVNGERVFGEYDEGVLANFKLTDGDIDFLCSHDMVVSGIWGHIEDDLWKIQARSVPVLFDFSNQPEHPVVQKAISHVDYAFFASDDGDTPQLRAFMKDMQSRGPRCVVVTLGAEGSIAYDGKKFCTFGIVPCKVVDTMGAGDSYIAGFIYGLMHNKAIAECMRMGAENSSVTLTYQGAW